MTQDRANGMKEFETIFAFKVCEELSKELDLELTIKDPVSWAKADWLIIEGGPLNSPIGFNNVRSLHDFLNGMYQIYSKYR